MGLPNTMSEVDYDALPEGGARRIEVVHGYVIVCESPTPQHQQVDLSRECLPVSIRAVGVGLVIRCDRLIRDAAIAAQLESGAERPVPDFGGAGLPP